MSDAYVALIPARGGSKSIPQKNILTIAGKPLLYWVCRAVQECPHITAGYVATDDVRIADAVAGFQFSKLHTIERAPDTATDTASTESAMLDFAQRVAFDNLVLIQATSPLLDASDLTRACETFEAGGYDSLLSLVRQKRFTWKEGPNGEAIPTNYDPVTRPRRQDFDGYLVENGALYIMRRGILDEYKCRLGGKMGYVEMSADSYLELDEPEDRQMIEQLLLSREQERGGVAAKMRAIKMVATDIDGVLTDSGMYYSENGDELKKFSTRDGMAFEMLRNAGLLTAIITRENRELNERRAAKLQVDELFQGCLDKVSVMETILERCGVTWEQVAYIGDDYGDVPLLQRVGLGACPSDAMAIVKRNVPLVLDTPGGHGAYREFVERILQVQGKLD